LWFDFQLIKEILYIAAYFLLMKRLFLFSLSCFSLFSCKDNFELLLEDERSNVSLLKNIQSNKNIDYLRIDEMYGGSTLKKYEYVNYKHSLEIPFPKEETGGMSLRDMSYRIAYIENNKWHFVSTEETLKKFIGEVDNVYEAFLIARIDGYEIDNTSEGNGFKKVDFGYKLKVMKSEICPVSKEGFVVHIYKDGTLKQIERSLLSNNHLYCLLD